MTRYFIVMDGKKFYNNIPAVLHKIDARDWDDKEYLFFPFKLGKSIAIAGIERTLKDCRIIDPASCEQIDELYKQIYELKLKVCEVVKKATLTKAKVSDFPVNKDMIP